ncbi:MAG: glycosyl hydrolase family 18 protein, partial [Chloroflexota bacterium]
SQALAAKVAERLTGWAGAYDYKALGEQNDFLILMAYGYVSASNATPGSTAPIGWVENSLAYAVSEIPASKVLLGVAWYGYDWNRTTGPPAVARRYSQVSEAAQRNGATIQYTEDGSPFVKYSENGQSHEVWFENRRSVEAKLSLVGKYGVAGAAGWRMGHEDPGVWQAMNASLGFRTWLLAEGCTSPPFQTWILIQNPNLAQVQATVTFMKEGGDTLVKEYRIGATSRFSVFANEVIPNAAFSTRVDSDLPVIVERAMYFGYDGHASAGVNAPSRVWYLPEGFTGGMDTWILVMNPNPAPTTATISFLKEDGSVEKRTFQMNPSSRLNVFANQIVPGTAFSTLVEADLPVVAERATYFNGGKGGHGSMGVPYTARKWYLAEGFTGGMDTFILLMNPGSAAAQATVTFMKESGETVVRIYSLKPTSRFTIPANSVVPGVSFATRVESDRPIVVERAMYWGSGEGGHSSMGVTAPANSWFLAEGCTASPFTEYVLMMNPNASPATAIAYFMKDDGQVVVRQYDIGPYSRFTVQVNAVAPNAAHSTRIEASQPIVVERSMYFGRGGTNTTGVSQ